MPELSPDAKAKFDKWHLRQRELGACRCHECREVYPQKPAQGPAELGIQFIKVGDPQPGDIPMEDLQAISNSVAAGIADAGRVIVEGTDEEKERFFSRHDADLVGPRTREEHAMIVAKEDVLSGAIPLRELIERAKAQHPVLNAIDVWEARKKAAMGGGAYDRDPAKLYEAEQRMLQANLKLQGERTEAMNRAIEAEASERKARLTYEQARANLEREFGAEQVGRSIAALEKLLSLRADFDDLEDRVGEVANYADTIRDEAEELVDEARVARDKLKALKRKLDD